jgi:GNAT superfamily N-acetyltransferase
MLDLEHEEWADRAFSRSEMRRQIASPRSVVGIVEITNDLVGFAVATPGWSERAATLNNVLIAPAHRGRGLVWPLLAEVERELTDRDYRTLVIDARVENGFADAVERRYGGRARVLASDHPSPYGPQRTIRVTLGAPESARVRPPLRDR